jgi:hypothetical protein
MSTAVPPAQTGASQQAVIDTALLLLKQLGLSPADLAAVPQDRPPIPTFVEYIPAVAATVSAGTRRAYGTYWNRITEHWGTRHLDEPTPTEIKQLMAWHQLPDCCAASAAGTARTASAPSPRPQHSAPRSFALRSGALAGETAAKAAVAGSPAAEEASLAEYAAAVNATLVPEMRAGRMLLSAFTRHAGSFHAGLATPKGWHVFVKMCRSEISFSDLVGRPSARLTLAMLNRL